MTTMQITLPDDIFEAVRIEAEHFGTTAEQRVQRLIVDTHRPISDKLSPDEIRRRLAAMDEHAAGAAERNALFPPPAFVDDSRETIYDDPRLYPSQVRHDSSVPEPTSEH